VIGRYDCSDGAEAAIREAALVRNHPPDLINVALERIIEASLELPGYSTLDDMATTIRAEVNEAIFAGIVARMGPEGRLRAQGLLATAASDGRSMFNRLKKPAKRATWSRFRAQAEYLDEVDEIGDTAYWLEGVAPSKVTDFAGEAAAQDVDTLSRYGDAKRLAWWRAWPTRRGCGPVTTWPRCCASGSPPSSRRRRPSPRRSGSGSGRCRRS